MVQTAQEYVCSAPLQVPVEFKASLDEALQKFEAKFQLA